MNIADRVQMELRCLHGEITRIQGAAISLMMMAVVNPAEAERLAELVGAEMRKVVDAAAAAATTLCDAVTKIPPPSPPQLKDQNEPGIN